MSTIASNVMEIIIRTGFAAITHSIKFNPQNILKGEALAVSHTQRVEECSPTETSPGRISGSVIRQTSVTSPPYKVRLEVYIQSFFIIIYICFNFLSDSFIFQINYQRHVFAVHCTCISAEGGHCKHVYALIHYVNSDRSVSKTSVEQEWGKPSDTQLGKDLYAKGVVITERFKTKATKKKITVQAYIPKLSDFENHPCALLPILREECRTVADRISSVIINDVLNDAIRITDMRSCEACILNLNILAEESDLYRQDLCIVDAKLTNFYEQHVILTAAQIVELCMRTFDQSSCREWFDARKLRISASSKAHSIKVRRKKDISALLERFLGTSQSAPSKAQEYGTTKEKFAVAEYERQYHVRVYHVGLVVLESQPWLCASPDGVVVEDGCITKLVEIKCPFVCRNLPIYDLEAKKFNVTYLRFVNDNAELSAGHQYYTQCQMQMYVVGLTECDLFVWSPKGSYAVTVSRDNTFLEELIPKLHDFYFNRYLPALLDNEKENVTTK